MNLQFESLLSLPDRPALPVPDYHALSEAFRTALLDPDNQVLHRSKTGQPAFGAYIGSKSQELVTYGILCMGEFLSGRDSAWIASALPEYFSPEYSVYLNSPGGARIEFWYLFYVNALAGALTCALSPQDELAIQRLASSADVLHNIAEKMKYDFHHQGYRFDQELPYTQREEYRQPDAVAGLAYCLLLASLRANRPDLRQKSVKALQHYQAFHSNPWYEVPSGSAGLLAACWHRAHGQEFDIRKLAGWIFDPVSGPMHTGSWCGEEVGGLMMGWRGMSRQEALASAYSMESLMPLQHLLPALRYCPGLAKAVLKYSRNLLANFQLFFAQGSKPLQQTRPELSPHIPYEKLQWQEEGLLACGDSAGERSVYGGGYLAYTAALCRPAGHPDLLALDLSLTDWLQAVKYPVFLLENLSDTCQEVRMAPSDAWRTLTPSLYGKEGLNAKAFDAKTGEHLGLAKGLLRIELPPASYRFVALLPEGVKPRREAGFLMAGQSELLYLGHLSQTG